MTIKRLTSLLYAVYKIVSHLSVACLRFMSFVVSVPAGICIMNSNETVLSWLIDVLE